jgi:hypothetical protein
MLYPLSYEGLPLPPTRGAGCTAGGAGSSCRDGSEGEPGAACCGQNCGYRASRNAASLVPAKGLRTCQNVRSVTLDRLVRDHNLERVDILKLNIEGSETAVLRSTGVLDRVRTIVFEYHAELADMSLDELLDSLTGFEVRRMRRHSPGHVVVVMERASSEGGTAQTPPLGTR